MSFELLTVPCLSDNYAFLAHDADKKVTLLVDAPEPEPILRKLEEKSCIMKKNILNYFIALLLVSFTKVSNATTIDEKINENKLSIFFSDEGLVDSWTIEEIDLN